MLDRLFAGLTRKQKLALANRDAREIAYVFNDMNGDRMYNATFTNDLLARCDAYARKTGKGIAS
jgi:hypothetical protein